MKINSSQQFKDSLQKGLGRAFDYVCQNKNKEELRENLLNACINNLSYDRQCEENLAKYLFELINLTNDIEFYRQNIFNALPKAIDSWDLDQLYSLASIWAKQGDQEAREVIYDTFNKQEFNESWLGGIQIIEIDDISGLLFVAEIVGKRLLQDRDLWEDNYLIEETSENCGSQEVRAALEKESLTNTNVKAYLDAVISHQNNLASKNHDQGKNSKKIPSLNTVLKQIQKPRYPVYMLSRFGKYASEKEVEQVFDKLLKETRREQLIRYLRIFNQRQLPRLDNYLLDLVKTHDEELQSVAITALSNNNDNSLRILALRLLKQNPELLYEGILKLLVNNYQSGDFKIIESMLDISQDIDDKHMVAMDLIKLADSQKTLELKTCLLWAYENTPCSYCRANIVENLVNLNQAPKSLLEECLHDCSSETRTLVSNFRNK